MKTLIFGSRSIKDYSLVKYIINRSKFIITEIISGHARGVDEDGEKYGMENKIPVKIYPANWNLYGKSAGFIRNKEMAMIAEQSIGIWDGKSKGTLHTIHIITRDKNINIPLYLYNDLTGEHGLYDDINYR